MGYRSDVRSIIYGEPDKVLAFWTKQQLAGAHALVDSMGLQDYIEHYTINNGALGVIDLKMDSVKWDDSYKNVKSWRDILQYADEDGLDYEFVRIGEATNDIEYDGTMNSEGLIGYSCTISDNMAPRDEPNEQDAESQG